MATTLGQQLSVRLAECKKTRDALSDQFQVWLLRAVKESFSRVLVPGTKHYVGRIPYEFSNTVSYDILKTWVKLIGSKEELTVHLQNGKNPFTCDCDDGCDGCAIGCYVDIPL